MLRKQIFSTEKRADSFIKVKYTAVSKSDQPLPWYGNLNFSLQIYTKAIKYRKEKVVMNIYIHYY